jgi:hypothetical protein
VEVLDGERKTTLWQQVTERASLTYSGEKPLPRGQTYHWRLKVRQGGREETVVESQFRVITLAKERQLAPVKVLAKSEAPADVLLAAAAYEAHGVTDEALPLYERAARKLPDAVSIQVALACLCRRAGREAEAGRARQRVLALRPDASLLPHDGPPRPTKRYAVLVGINRYDDPRFTALRYAENDVTALADVLRQAGYRVVLLTGSSRVPRLRATKANIEARLKEVLSERRRGDMVVLALAGHGLQFADKGGAYFCPQDANPVADKKETLVSLEAVYAGLDTSLGERQQQVTPLWRSGGRGEKKG